MTPHTQKDALRGELKMLRGKTRRLKVLAAALILLDIAVAVTLLLGRDHMQFVFR